MIAIVSRVIGIMTLNLILKNISKYENFVQFFIIFSALSTLFHQKAEQYKENVPKWNTSCEISNVSTDITTLESSIHQVSIQTFICISSSQNKLHLN